MESASGLNWTASRTKNVPCSVTDIRIDPKTGTKAMVLDNDAHTVAHFNNVKAAAVTTKTLMPISSFCAPQFIEISAFTEVHSPYMDNGRSYIRYILI